MKLTDEQIAELEKTHGTGIQIAKSIVDAIVSIQSVEKQLMAQTIIRLLGQIDLLEHRINCAADNWD